MIIAFGILVVLLVVLDIVLIFALKESNKIYEVLIERLTEKQIAQYCKGCKHYRPFVLKPDGERRSSDEGN